MNEYLYIINVCVCMCVYKWATFHWSFDLAEIMSLAHLKMTFSLESYTFTCWVLCVPSPFCKRWDCHFNLNSWTFWVWDIITAEDQSLCKAWIYLFYNAEKCTCWTLNAHLIPTSLCFLREIVWSELFEAHM